jgi:hypothetical protein
MGPAGVEDGPEGYPERLAEIHRNEPLSCDRLIELIITEMKHIIGNKRRIKPNFLALVETLFSSSEVKEAEKRLKGWEHT